MYMVHLCIPTYVMHYDIHKNNYFTEVGKIFLCFDRSALTKTVTINYFIKNTVNRNIVTIITIQNNYFLLKSILKCYLFM